MSDNTSMQVQDTNNELSEQDLEAVAGGCGSSYSKEYKKDCYEYEPKECHDYDYGHKSEHKHHHGHGHRY